MKKLLACLLVVATSGCPDVTVDPDETAQGPVVEFDPARSLATKARYIPFPNDLVRDPATGKINLSEQACESASSKATRENILNKLDGFGTYQTVMQVSFSAAVDATSLDGKIVMYQVAKAGAPVSPAGAMPIPVTIVRVGTTPRFSTGDCSAPEQANAVSFVPNIPLEQKSTYFVALLKGIKSTDGKDFTPSYTWGLVAATENPVTLDDQGNVLSDRTPLDPADATQRAQLQSLAGIWNLHAGSLAFLDQATGTPREDILVGFQFTTQTVSDPLDPTVAGSPANKLANVGILQLGSVTGRFGTVGTTVCTAQGETNATQCFIKLALGGCNPATTGCTVANYAAGNAACGLYNCTAVGDVLGGGILNANYQAQLPNAFDAAKPLQGPWSDPVHPDQQATLTLEALITVPTGNPPMNGGWPVIIFGHGLGSSKESAITLAGRAAAAGFAAVAIDTSAHGSRAVRISSDPALGCLGRCFSGSTPTATTCDTVAQCGAGETCGNLAVTPSLAPPAPTTAPQCYAPFLSADLATTRDGIRQTVLDHLRVVNALKACGETNCPGLPVDVNRIYYASLSLGSIVGTISAAMSPDIKAAVLNVGGVGWVDILENTETLSIRCSLVNGLIDAGILVGDKWNGSDMGLCTTDAWKMQPGFATFSTIARWVLDPADPANFARRLAAKRVLVQEVVGDTVVPNVATQRQGALLGLAPMAGDPWDGAASAAITTMPTTNKYLRYTSDANNVFVHSSLLRPAPTADSDGVNGTLRLQVDAATFLSLNNQ